MQAAALSLSDLAALKFNRDARQSDQQSIRTAGDGLVVKAGRSTDPIGPQLVTAAGLDAVEAVGFGLSELAVLKFNRDTAAGDRQSIRTFAAPSPDEIVWQLGDDDN